MSPTVADISEAQLLQRIDSILSASEVQTSNLIIGRGDDAALVRIPGQMTLASDLMLEGRHFRRYWHPASWLGMKTLLVSISDTLAMGARPRFALISMGVPGDLPLAWFDHFYEGLARVARAAGLQVIGGDLSRFERIVVDSTVTGEIQSSHAWQLNSFVPGQRLYVTGPLGGGRAGLAWLLEHDKQLREDKRGRGNDAVEPVDTATLQTGIESYAEAAGLPLKGDSVPPEIKILARVSASRSRGHDNWLPAVLRYLVPPLRSGYVERLQMVTAATDISDGLAREVQTIAQQSGVGIVLDEGIIPPVSGLNALAKQLHQEGSWREEWVLSGGDDYELLIGIEPDRLPPSPGSVPLWPVGWVQPGSGVYVHRQKKIEPLTATGYDPFAS